MTTITAYPHIVKEHGAAARLDSHPRTRVAMIVMDYLVRGLGPEDIVRHYPYLKLSEVHSAMAYYHVESGLELYHFYDVDFQL